MESKPSMDAADYAIRMANKNNSLLIALHVFFSQTGYAYSAGLFGGLATPSSIKKIYDDAKKEAQVWFDRIGEKFYEQSREEQKEGKSKAELLTEVVVTATSIVAAVVEYAEEHNIDLIVIGTRGRSGFKRLILGSVATGVITYAHCPVMVIK